MRHPDDSPARRSFSSGRAVAIPVEQNRNSSLLWLMLATVATLLLMTVPFASVVTFPIRMFVTFIHEGSHALAALLSGFYVIRMTIHWDGSGLTLTSGAKCVRGQCRLSGHDVVWRFPSVSGAAPRPHQPAAGRGRVFWCCCSRFCS
jgi:hypothetical protein